MTRKDFREMLSAEHRDLLEANFATHADPQVYHPRGVLLYGVAEILRSRMCVELLESDQIDAFGRLMKISHDGDPRRPGPVPTASTSRWNSTTAISGCTD